MSERMHALRQLRSFIKKRALSFASGKYDLADDEDNYLARKVRTDECRMIMREIDRMLEFKSTGRKKKA